MQEAAAFLKSRQPVNLILIVINFAVFLVLSVMGNTEDGYFMMLHGAMYPPLILEQGEYYRLFTSMFLHFGVQHLFYNMLVLLFLGDELERIAGKLRYLVIYLGGGIIGNLASLAVSAARESYAISAGASGAVFAVIGALVGVVWMNRGRIPDSSGKRLILMAVLSVLQGLTATGIDGNAHLGGLLGGLLLALLFRRRLNWSSWKNF